MFNFFNRDEFTDLIFIHLKLNSNIFQHIIENVNNKKVFTKTILFFLQAISVLQVTKQFFVRNRFDKVLVKPKDLAKCRENILSI